MRVSPPSSSAAYKVPTHDVPNPTTIKKATAIVRLKVLGRLTDDGIVKSFVGKPTFKTTNKPGVLKVAGNINIDAQWGDHGKEKFSALVDVNKGTLTKFTLLP